MLRLLLVTSLAVADAAGCHSWCEVSCRSGNVHPDCKGCPGCTGSFAAEEDEAAGACTCLDCPTLPGPTCCTYCDGSTPGKTLKDYSTPKPRPAPPSDSFAINTPTGKPRPAAECFCLDCPVPGGEYCCDYCDGSTEGKTLTSGATPKPRPAPEDPVDKVDPDGAPTDGIDPADKVDPDGGSSTGVDIPLPDTNVPVDPPTPGTSSPVDPPTPGTGSVPPRGPGDLTAVDGGDEEVLHPFFGTEPDNEFAGCHYVCFTPGFTCAQEVCSGCPKCIESAKTPAPRPAPAVGGFKPRKRRLRGAEPLPVGER
mmetsp:Transcript_8423/g.25312  ORF Transcript_8423/g.25312 Transcript_8423/m.25312 type:complete len:310 (+) Transcript_8423:151-1080(+)